MKRNGLLVLGLLALTACSQSLDRDRIAQSIQQDVIKRGGISLKTVTCPATIKPEAGQSFECVGETDAGYTFTIPVKQQDDRGTVVWDLPNAKGLLNLAKFEAIVQAAVQEEIGSRPIIRCGGLYKAVQPGQTFECAVDIKDTPPPNPTALKSKTVKVRPGKPDTILVTIDADRNVNWQRLIAGVVPNSTADVPSDKTPPATTTPPAADSSKAPSAKIPSAKGSAADFLNQPGAADQF